MSQLHRIENASGLQFAKPPVAAHNNLPPAALYEHAVARGEGRVAKNGPLVVLTGQHTGRSASDKFIVRDVAGESNVWWDNNKPMSPAHFDALHASMMGYAQGHRCAASCAKPHGGGELTRLSAQDAGSMPREMRVDCDAENHSAI